ncbi:MAG: phosphoribosylanthranilate isomerase [Candidatus Kerfeldbacteria bacterium]|nr:phosphoribosylanthranilate isomerase [Candidatus Kerfeldbacteria bacterium]
MKLKVCGITNEADALAAAQAGVSYLGYILNYTASPRFVLPNTVRSMIQRTKQLYPTVQHVAVLVKPTDQLVAEVEQLDVDLLQIYGAIPSNVTKPIWQSEIGGVSQPQSPLVTMLHCDAGFGSGNTLSLDVLTQLRPELPLVIAGGITVDNVREIIQLCQPTVVDVNSGVESVPGKKDINKIYELRKLILQN